MDEKGCQRGGGRKRSAEKFFVPRNRRPCYRTKSDNLELVTIIECVNAEGSSIKPGFVFPGKEFHEEWLEVDPEIRYAHLMGTDRAYRLKSIVLVHHQMAGQMSFYVQSGSKRHSYHKQLPTTLAGNQ